MQINFSLDRILHLLALILVSFIFAYIIEYWTESGFLFSLSGGVTISVQLSNVFMSLTGGPETTGETDKLLTEENSKEADYNIISSKNDRKLHRKLTKK